MVVMNLFAGQEQRCRCRERTGKAKGEKNLDSSIDTYALPCVKQIASGKMLCYMGSSALCSVVTKMGGMWVGWEEGKKTVYIYI